MEWWNEGEYSTRILFIFRFSIANSSNWKVILITFDTEVSINGQQEPCVFFSSLVWNYVYLDVLKGLRRQTVKWNKTKRKNYSTVNNASNLNWSLTLIISNNKMLVGEETYIDWYLNFILHLFVSNLRAHIGRVKQEK